MTDLLIPLLVSSVCLWACLRGVDVFAALLHGAEAGLRTVCRLLPPLIALLPAVYMLRAAGLPEAFAALLRPVLDLLGIPPETVPLMLLRPISGSGALALGSDIISAHGPDSLIGRTAAVMLGSTETTFYVIAAYFGAVGIKKTRHAVPAALAADLAGFLAAALTARLLWA